MVLSTQFQVLIGIAIISSASSVIVRKEVQLNGTHGHWLNGTELGQVKALSSGFYANAECIPKPTCSVNADCTARFGVSYDDEVVCCNTALSQCKLRDKEAAATNENCKIDIEGAANVKDAGNKIKFGVMVNAGNTETPSVKITSNDAAQHLIIQAALNVDSSYEVNVNLEADYSVVSCVSLKRLNATELVTGLTPEMKSQVWQILNRDGGFQKE